MYLAHVLRTINMRVTREYKGSESVPGYMYDDKDTTAKQPGQSEDILQHNDGESVADNDFASCKRSKAGLWEGMGTRWKCRHCECGSLSVSRRIW